MFAVSGGSQIEIFEYNNTTVIAFSEKIGKFINSLKNYAIFPENYKHNSMFCFAKKILLF